MIKNLIKLFTIQPKSTFIHRQRTFLYTVLEANQIIPWNAS